MAGYDEEGAVAPQSVAAARGGPRRRIVATARAKASSPVGGAILVILGTLLLWQLASLHRLIVGPTGSLEFIYEGLRTGELRGHFLWSLRAVAVSMALAIPIGVGIGLFVGSSSHREETYSPFVHVYGNVPKLTLYPIILLIFGIGFWNEVIFGLLPALYPMIVNGMAARDDVDRVHLKAVRSMGGSSSQVLRTVVLPSMAPSLLAGIRIGFGIGTIHVVLAEAIAAKQGLGTLIWAAFTNLQLDVLYGVIFLTFLIAMAGSSLLWFVAKIFRPDADLVSI